MARTFPIFRLPSILISCALATSFALAVSCGQPTRDNPLDPETSSGDEGIQVLLSGRDEEDQILLHLEAFTDVRADLLARISLPVQTGALQIVANFPIYAPIVSIDRFSDTAGTFFKRSDQPGLPEAGEAIDFDDDFLRVCFGPNGERVEFYHFDVRTPQPAPVYVLIDRRNDVIPGQLLIFDELPGDQNYNDLRQISEVKVTDAAYRANTYQSLADIQAAELEITETEAVLNCVMVPDGSEASRRFDSADPAQLKDGWYRDQIVKYFLFENPDSKSLVAFAADQVTSNIMYAFLENDESELDGFAIDSATGRTHNVVTRLPEQDGYSPLWTLQAIKLLAFDRVINVATAAQEASIDVNAVDLPVLNLNAPVVGVGPASAGD